MGERIDSRAYSAALKELREKHLAEFEEIRERKLVELGFEGRRKFTEADINLAFNYIVGYVKEHGVTPNVTSLTRALKIGSTEKTRHILIELEQRGKIHRFKTRSTAKGQGSYSLKHL